MKYINLNTFVTSRTGTEFEVFFDAEYTPDGRLDITNVEYESRINGALRSVTPIAGGTLIGKLQDAVNGIEYAKDMAFIHYSEERAVA